MNTKQKVILKGLLELSETERIEILQELKTYRSKTFSEQQWLNESMEKAQRVLGPISGSCPCCGR